ncbi:hypothetical protein TWF694_006407 [Orbilia ellipsospora]|uniref:Uncharacterized protein n=1 Tax=Orbilia ellipsospora TaxID=2528407 RepID=A0AAV9XK42_9PEZI
MKSYFVGIAVLWAWAGGAFALEPLERRNDQANSPGGSKDNGISPRQPAPNPFDRNKNLTPRQELNNLPDPNPNGLQMISFNVQPDVYNNDPIVLRKNPTRLHQEYFCHWRSPKDGFSFTWGFGKMNSYLRTYPTERCNGPGGFCTPVWCGDGYMVAVCNWSDTPWSVPCYEIVTQARDILIAVANRNMYRWEQGLAHDQSYVGGRSERQKINDQKKICIPHASVWTPEMIGYTWFNANPHYQVQLYYGFTSDIFKCSPLGGLLDLVAADGPLTQEQYLDKWYNVPSLDDTNSTDTSSGGSNPKPSAPKKGLNGTISSGSSKSGTLPLPMDGSVPGYRGPNLKDYDPVDSIPPQEMAAWRWKQQLKSLGVTQSTSATAPPPQNTTVPKKFPDWYSKKFPVIPPKKSKTRAYRGGRSSGGTSTSIGQVDAEETGASEPTSVEKNVKPTGDSVAVVKTSQGTTKMTSHKTVTTPAPTTAARETQSTSSTKGDKASKSASRKSNIEVNQKETGENNSTVVSASITAITPSVPPAATSQPPSASPTTIVTSVRNKLPKKVISPESTI